MCPSEWGTGRATTAANEFRKAAPVNRTSVNGKIFQLLAAYQFG
jgi:hypothetical protein